MRLSGGAEVLEGDVVAMRNPNYWPGAHQESWFVLNVVIGDLLKLKAVDHPQIASR